MTVPTSDALDAVTITPRVVAVEGIPMSGVLARVAAPRATLVAVHGGATTSAYFNPPGHPELSLLRLGAAMGFTVLAIDRPGFGASALYGNEFDDTTRRINLTYAAMDKMLGDAQLGAGLFLVAHSNGCELALRMAMQRSAFRGSPLLGLELSGTGLRQTDRAREILAGATRSAPPSGLRELLYEPAAVYPPGVDRAVRIDGGPISPDYEGRFIVSWRKDFPALAAHVTVPVRFTAAEHERVWCSDTESLAQIAGQFSSSPRALSHIQPGAGHNLSLGHSAADYHLSILTFVDECITATTDFTTEAS